MCSPQHAVLRRPLEMSHSFSVVKRALIVISAVLALLLCSFAQENTKKTTKQKTEPAKASQPAAGQPGAASGAQSPSAAAAAGETAGTSDEEQKGPWHGLTWRSIGPYPPRTALALSRLVGYTHPSYSRRL